jgi:hypothetical protein
MPIASTSAVVLDCPDPRALAEFYRALVGGEITYAEDEWVNLPDGGTVLLSFQRVLDYRATDWPSTEHGQQFHIDVTVDDVDEAEPHVPGIGPTQGIASRNRRRLELARLPRPGRSPILPLLGLARPASMLLAAS